MSIIDTILNLAGLLLWLKWRDKGQELSPRGISLITTLKKTGSGFPRIWFLFALAILLALRSLLYWQLGSALDWLPRVWFGVIPLAFRSDVFGKMFFFSFLSFAAALGIFYLCLLLLSILNGTRSESDPVQNLVRTQLGKLESLHGSLKIFLPWLFMTVLWCALNKPLAKFGILPEPISLLQLMGQGAVASAGIYLAWKYLIIGILLLHLLNSYIYFGAWPFWNFIDNSARRILKLIAWIPLRMGKIDFAPIVFIISIVAVTSVGLNGFTIHGLNRRVPGLIDLFEWLGR